MDDYVDENTKKDKAKIAKRIVKLSILTAILIWSYYNVLPKAIAMKAEYDAKTYNKYYAKGTITEKYIGDKKFNSNNYRVKINITDIEVPIEIERKIPLKNYMNVNVGDKAYVIFNENLEDVDAVRFSTKTLNEYAKAFKENDKNGELLPLK